MRSPSGARSAVGVLALASLVFGSTTFVAPALQQGVARAMPMSTVDETKVPHYFGPYPNYANSPQARPDATVTITGVGSVGSGAQAVATVDPRDGSIRSITVTNPGVGYANGASVSIGGQGSGAEGTATVAQSVVAVSTLNVTATGSGYTRPVVTISGGGAAQDATARAYGGVDKVTVSNPGSFTFTSVGEAKVTFDLPDLAGGVRATGMVVLDTGGNVTGIDVMSPGSGYSFAPKVTVTSMYAGLASGVVATATLGVSSLALQTFGSGYTSAPDVAITDAEGTGAGALATAEIGAGAVTSIAVTNAGSGYLTPGLKKFKDPLPNICKPGNPAMACPTDGSKYIPLAVADGAWTDGVHTHANADTYEIALVQYAMKFHSSLPPTLVRGYVQLKTPGLTGVGNGVPLFNKVRDPMTNELMDVPAMVKDANGNPVQAIGVTEPQYLGPTIVATRGKAVRIVFRNLLPTGMAGDLFLPVDTTVMGSGMGYKSMGAAAADTKSVMDGVRNPMCTKGFMEAKDASGNVIPGKNAMPDECFTQNRATLHLHGGVTPWISDGTPHQWITPAGESTSYPEGVSVQNVPDMNVCGAKDDGCQTFYYTNQQSARLMFYHDHSWGITRLNVYAGEAAGYLITDAAEAKLIGTEAAKGPLFDVGVGIPLVIQDKTFVPAPTALAAQDPTWDTKRWGGEGSLWVPHVYMPAQNPGDPSGMSAYGRWMYGPWFWPPANNVPYQPIPNPYWNKDPKTGFTADLAKPCTLDDPTSWQYNVDPFCEPELIPGTPNVTVGMEAFNDTPVVNGTAYPTLELEPKSYRLRILNAANDRFWNLQWYVADPTTANPDTGATEVALKASEVAAAQLDPNAFPTPDTTLSPVGPSWIQIGTEGGFLPAPVVIPNQPTTWITDPTRFDVGNVDKHSLLLAPAERADVVVDFSQFAGRTLILYNDAPAAFPARVPGYDYYTDGPDLSPAGAPPTLPGYGPNTRTIMQVKIKALPSNVSPTPFNLVALQNAFKHHADGSGVFESSQHPIIVGQAAYNSAYGTNFVSDGWCNAPGSNSKKCDGFARISEQGGFMWGFNSLKSPSTKQTIKIEPKGIHDEMNSTSFDEYGRMQATMGVEAPRANPLVQNIVLYPYVNPTTELVNGTRLPTGDQMVPMWAGEDGTQIWKITHNGVDTHPIHFHLFDVQLINRVTWDNIIIPPDANELGWKDTIRVSPLEDTIVALRPVIPQVPFDQPNSIRLLNPAMPEGSTLMFNNVDVNGNPTTRIKNVPTNFGHEYVWHCHILSHEEMDMMRPVSLAMPPLAPTLKTVAASGSGGNQIVTLNWTDNSNNETGFVVYRGLTNTGPWTKIATLPVNETSHIDPIGNTSTLDFFYKVVAVNTVGYTGTAGYPTLTTSAESAVLSAAPIAAQVPPSAPSAISATLQAGPRIAVTWTDTAKDETGFVLERSTDGGATWINVTPAAPLPPRTGTGSVSYTDTTVVAGASYVYRVSAVNAAGLSPASPVSNVVTILAPPTAPASVTATAAPQGGTASRVTLTWTDLANNETGYRIQRANDAAFTAGLVTSTTTVGVGPSTGTTMSFTTGNLARNTPYYFRVQAYNGAGASAWVNVTPFPTYTTP